ncbi:unnamed protein product [Hyaloperonospora brassicae]|uniref:DUF4371 domain-containing protein n=1 Tax=Hyaloperonospora brassicae TaxID=162125 RepID=A0AAV0TTW4_HYABA|nr:unnamed protein product [Hyaloperonospora brassicae]
MAPKTTPFQEKHALEFGLEIIKTEKGGAHTVRCLFCIYDRRDNIKSQYEAAWQGLGRVQRACNTEKRKYFTGKTKIMNTLHHFLDVEGDTIKFQSFAAHRRDHHQRHVLQKREILDNAEDEDEEDFVESDAAKEVADKIDKKFSEKANAMKLFVKDSKTVKYVITVKNVMRYDLALNHVGSVMSFLHAAMGFDHAKRRTQTPKIAGINSLMVGQFIRALVASNLQRIADFMGDASVWAISLACDGSTHRGQSFFDMRLRFCYRGVLVNLHLVAIPMFDRHTSQIILDTVCKFMDTLYGSWRGKLFYVASEGENAMTGHHASLVTRLCAAA